MVFEDENILAVNKPVNIAVTGQEEITLTKLVQKKWGNSVNPCHRLDRNTSRNYFICQK